MRFQTRIVIICLISYAHNTNISTAYKKKQMKFERFECLSGNTTKFAIKECRMDQIESDRISFYLETDIINPLFELYSHHVVFYKYRVYKKFPLDFWEDICGWLNKKKTSYMLDWTIGQALEYVKYDGDLTCPLHGNLTMSFKNVSLNEKFPIIPLLPSGRYRFETNFTEGDRNIILGGTRFYMAIVETRNKK